MSDTSELQETLDEIRAAVAEGKSMFLLNVEDVGAVAMSAAAWVMGLPVAHNENLPTLVERIERIAAVVGVTFNDGWWQS